MNIDNPRFKSWQWIFFIEGILTAGFGCIMYFLLADYPEKSWLLNTSEKMLLKQRMAQDQMDGGHRPIDKSRLLVHVRDPLIYAQALIFYCVNFGSNTILTFSAIIVNQMGYSPSASQAMQAIPGLCGFIGILLSRYYPKWFGSHYAGALFVSGWIITASVILLATTSNGARIFALCLLAFGSFGAGGIGPGWVMSNVGGPTRSAVSGALNVSFGGLGALSASYIYQNHDAPRYLFGHGMNLFAGLLAAITATVAYLIIRRRNKQKVTEPLDISHMTDRKILSLECCGTVEGAWDPLSLPVLGRYRWSHKTGRRVRRADPTRSCDLSP
ncbi:transporter [Coemansia sp. RSA 2708]|nr:transporter [Coemansia sp. RSA 2708]